MTTQSQMIAWVTPIGLLLGCAAEPDRALTSTFVASAASPFSEWSEPENLGSTINTTFNEQGPTLSNDELSLYFGSDRPGGIGGFDIWVSQRALQGMRMGNSAKRRTGCQHDLRRDWPRPLDRWASALLQEHSARRGGPRGRVPIKTRQPEGRLRLGCPCCTRSRRQQPGRPRQVRSSCRAPRMARRTSTSIERPQGGPRIFTLLRSRGTVKRVDPPC